MLVKLRGQEVPAIIIANKCDLLSVRQVTDCEGTTLAEQLNCPKFDVSVAEGYSGVSEAMEELVIQLKREYVKNCSQAAVSANDKTKSKLFTFKKGFKKRISRSHSDTVWTTCFLEQQTCSKFYWWSKGLLFIAKSFMLWVWLSILFSYYVHFWLSERILTSILKYIYICMYIGHVLKLYNLIKKQGCLRFSLVH